MRPWLLAGSQPRGRSGRRRVLRDAELGQQLERVEVQTRRHEAAAALFVDHAEGGGHVSPGRGEDRAVTTLQGPSVRTFDHRLLEGEGVALTDRRPKHGDPVVRQRGHLLLPDLGEGLAAAAGETWRPDLAVLAVERQVT